MHRGLRAEEWKKAVEQGYASRACDIIIRERPIPAKLLWILGQPTVIPHGRPVGYRKFGCRCQECRAWKQADNKLYRQRRKERENA